MAKKFLDCPYIVFVFQQDGVAKQVSFDTVDDLLTYVKEVAQTTTGSGDGGTNIITMTLSNGSTVDFSIKNVVSLPKNGSSFYFYGCFQDSA